MLTDYIQRLTEAIVRQEGMPLDHKNPGNLRDCPWYPRWYGKRVYSTKTSQEVEYSKGFWEPRSRAEGLAGLMHIIALHIAEGNSLKEFIYTYAPIQDGNKTEVYIKNVKEWTQTPDVDKPMWNFIGD